MGRSSSIEREVSDEAIRQYLDGIGLFNLLTAEDEVRLAKAIETGRKADLALESEKDQAKRRQLAQMVRAGEEARQTFIRSNLRLVVSIAKRYGHARLPFLDLVQEGNLGPDPRGREVRVPQGLQVLHLCHLVDPAGDHPCHRRQEPHHPGPGPHDGHHLPDAELRGQSDQASRPQADRRRAVRRVWSDRRQDPRGEKGRPRAGFDLRAGR